MRVWRIARPIWAPLAGEGARRRGGRWNSPGTSVVYTSERLSLAALETLVHVEPNLIPPDLTSYEIDVPDELRFETIAATALPRDWQDHPGHPVLRAIGDAWVRGCNSAVLLVPSVIVPTEMNLLINPGHPDGARITVARELPFRFDLRLIRE
ncbi:MAG: RES family NAD+ phosphorylase [Gemmatimonadota bacterium]|nr:RES family NAD+ phosphorylase [Gemmatimonadota bacterium]